MEVLNHWAAARGLLAARRILWRSLWMLLAVHAWAGQTEAHGQVSREYQIKGVLLYNLSQFVEWPSTAFTNDASPLRIGILGQDPFEGVLDAIVREETAGHRRLVVDRYQNVEEIKRCHILFISSSEQNRIFTTFSKLANRPILTVGDADEFIQQGGMVKFYKNEEDKIRLQVNLNAVKAAQLSMSAKLLRVADVLPKEGESRP